MGDGFGNATPGGPPTRTRPSSKMTKYIECWGADKPFANIAESTLAKNIELTVSTIFYYKHLWLIFIFIPTILIFQSVPYTQVS